MTFYTIHPRELEDIMRRKHGILIDVREADSNARNLPYEKIDQWMHRLPKNRPLVLYCDYGSTSLLAARKLGREGYEVYTVVGGIEAMRTSD